jgi:carboxymethylenebutenolidase
MVTTDAYRGLLAETTAVRSRAGDDIHAYLARPLGPGPFPAVVLLHHRPGWDDWYHEATRTFADHGYLAICPDLYCRTGHGDPDDVAEQVVADVGGCLDLLRSLPVASGRIGLFGTCSGARHAYLAACRLGGVDAVVNCWGGRIVMPPEDLNDRYPVAPIDLTAELPCPVLGLFGLDDRSPAPTEVDALEAALLEHGKEHEFHRYEGAGHGFFYHDRPAAYRAGPAVDGWAKVWDFLDRNLR